MKFTRALRQKIVKDFAEQNGGWFDPALFLATVEREGAEHPAFPWFQWEDEKAALEFRLDQARDFARGLVIRFEVRDVHRGKFRVTEHSAPLVVSPLDKRRKGGGYYISDPNSPEHMAELCRQAAQSLRWFVSRYDGALAYAGVNLAAFDKMFEALQLEHKQAA